VSALLWFVLGLVVMALELFLPGFVLVFFGIGAWITALVVWLGLVHGFNGQLFVFLGGSLASLFALRRWLQGTLQGHVSEKELSESKLDDFVGHKAKVTTAISPDTSEGRVEFRGTQWKATSKTSIAADTTVRIVWKKNLTLGVEPITRNQE
jgi:membrane protein implicated in regulation of membrane protease activity